jgi:hypothetical protein
MWTNILFINKAPIKHIEEIGCLLQEFISTVPGQEPVASERTHPSWMMGLG